MVKFKVDLDIVFKNLREIGVFLLPDTLKKHKHQGWMSTVFVIKSNKGPLIINLVKLVREHQINRVWDKFSGLSMILSSHSEIPAPRIFYSGIIGEIFVLVQKFFTGLPAGKRVLAETIISDDWHANKAIIIPNILRILANVHKIHLNGFGWPIFKNFSLTGVYNTWKEFFDNNAFRWIKIVCQADRRLLLSNLSPKILERFMKETIRRVNYSGPAVLIHGDSINPSNILIRNKNEIKLLDWEWSISGDPAWEFCDLGWWPLINSNVMSAYFQASKITNSFDQKEFLHRIKLYIPLWLLWGMYMHAEDSQPDIYIALRELLLKKIKIRFSESNEL